MERVGMILEREGNALDALLFKLVETRLLIEADESRFLTRASREVERARTRAREIGLLRATTVAVVRPGATLRDLADRATGPWPAILRDHHDALTRLLAEIEVAAHHNATAARTALQELGGHRVEQTVPIPCGVGVGDELGSGHQAPSVARAHPRGGPFGDAELDRLASGAALDAVLGTAARLHMPDLVDFLR